MNVVYLGICDCILNSYFSAPVFIIMTSKNDKAIDETAAVIIEILNNGIDDLRKRRKLTLADIHKLLRYV